MTKLTTFTIESGLYIQFFRDSNKQNNKHSSGNISNTTGGGVYRKESISSRFK